MFRFPREPLSGSYGQINPQAEAQTSPPKGGRPPPRFRGSAGAKAAQSQHQRGFEVPGHGYLMTRQPVPNSPRDSCTSLECPWHPARDASSCWTRLVRGRIIPVGEVSLVTRHAEGVVVLRLSLECPEGRDRRCCVPR